MTFNSISFLVFLPLAFLAAWGRFGWPARKLALLILSYLFYAAWNPPFVILLWISTVIDWFAARRIDRTQSRAVKIGCLLVSLFVNLGMLVYFKYGNFFLGNFQSLGAQLGLEVPSGYSVILPVGISFYTFQTLSYTLDIYLGRARAAKSFLDYALYVTFFPQLVAGPIVRATDFIPQCERPPKFRWRPIGYGAFLVLWGVFQKRVMADGVFAPVVEKVYDTTGSVSFIDAWCGTIAFAGQILCDFSGYSIAAIGVAMMLGFALPDNFRSPYAAIGFSDFWRRWHISLSSWIRDYLYIPLGGNRNGKLRAHFNLMLTMLLAGLWHGAGWTFIVWGCLHGLLLSMERVWVKAVWSRLRHASTRRVLGALGVPVTFLLVCVTWIFFRANDMTSALGICTSAFNPLASNRFSSLVPFGESRNAMLGMGALLSLQQLGRKRTLEDLVSSVPSILICFIMAAMLVATLLWASEDRAFIYFQF
ncbi:MBOAT family O-acyltransferase [Roseiconus lacunae]|uniref:MBOAT family protein n=1 Tax=Roseiconus lacunae TaxID=2605694 RepID=A0ABT7PQR6_9BACT|nr:MBOAT family protein [Roseiconus lacunae]MDM4018849.1 MBOAT family protein [Roseiconus lacunae]